MANTHHLTGTGPHKVIALHGWFGDQHAFARLGRHGGLLISAVLSALFVTVLGLGTLASVGSAVSLSLFWLIAIAAFRNREELNARSGPVVVAIAISTVVLGGFIIDLARNDPRSLASAALLILLSLGGQFAVEGGRRARDRRHEVA